MSLRVTPHEPQFVKPILPGFHTGLDIPVTFFANHLEGKMIKRSWKLRSDASEKTWEVIQDGMRFTRGWESFAKAHALRVGDIVIFKKESEMVFHVTPIGRSSCEIIYTPPALVNAESSSHAAAAGRSGATRDFISFEYSFVVEVTDKNLQEDILMFPAAATHQCSVLNKQCQEVILLNKEGNSWIANLLFCESKSMYYIRGGWTKFCCDNRYDIGCLVVFNVVGDGKTAPILCVCPESNECRQLLHDWLSRKSG